MASRIAKLAVRALAAGWIIAWWIWLIGYQNTFGEIDGQAYWGLELDTLYRGVRLGDEDAFLYSPAVALLFLPFSALPYDVFYAVFSALNLAALVYLVGWELAAISLFVVPISNEVARANIHLLLGAAIVIGFRYPGAWAWPLLTKVTPGVGVLWFAGRREWHRLAQAAAVTGLIVVATFAIVPDLWLRWVALLAENAGATRSTTIVEIPVLPRLALAAAVTLFAGWRNIPALVPVAALLAMPAIWVNSLALLAAVIPLLPKFGRTDGGQRAASSINGNAVVSQGPAVPLGPRDTGGSGAALGYRAAMAGSARLERFRWHCGGRC